ncbi:hypothetical protein D3C80_2057710 [compost metagenome]
MVEVEFGCGEASMGWPELMFGAADHFALDDMADRDRGALRVVGSSHAFMAPRM